MQLSVKGKQMDIGDSLRQHVEEQLTSIVGRFFQHSLDGHVVFHREAHLIQADIAVHAGRGIQLQSAGAATDPYVAFDGALERLRKRLHRYKDRLHDHHAARADGIDGLAAAQRVLDPEGPAATNGDHLIVAETETKIENLTVSEAVMRLELSGEPALLFYNRAHGRLNMVHLRADGHIGWIDPAPTHAKN